MISNQGVSLNLIFNIIICILLPAGRFCHTDKFPRWSYRSSAPHTANISLLYKDTEHGWNAQLASSFTGTKLALVSPFKDADQWDKAMFGLDLSAEKQFKNGISLFFKANNLLDAKRERYLKTVNKSNLEYEGQKSDKTIVGTYQYGRTFLLGVRYKL